MEVFGLLGVLAFMAFIGVLIAESKNRSKGEGCALGCLLGPIGWLIEALLPAQEGGPATAQKRSMSESSSEDSTVSSDWGRPRRKCPHCAEIILLEANVCKHCGREVEDGDQYEEVRRCRNCDAPISVNVEECPECRVGNPFE